MRGRCFCKQDDSTNYAYGAWTGHDGIGLQYFIWALFLSVFYKQVTWMLDDSRLLEGNKCVLALGLADTEL